MNEQKKTRKVGRPKVSKKDAHSRITPIRFTGDDLKVFREAAKKKQITLSKWIRETLRNAV